MDSPPLRNPRPGGLCFLATFGVVLAACAAGGGSGGGGGFTSIPDSERMANPSSVPPGQALAAARVVASKGEANTRLAIGSGESMQPVYGDNTVFLIAPIEWDKLEAGMQVAYRDPRGDMIIHYLLQRQGNGWLVKGLNNPLPDRYLVTRDNLIGYVYGTMAASKPISAPQE